MCVPFLHYHIARPNTSTSTILRWHCLLQHRSSFWGQLHVWPKSEASSTCDPLAVLGFGVTLICCCFSVESSHDQKYQQRMDGGSSFLHWIWQVWMVSPIFGQKRWSMSTPEKSAPTESAKRKSMENWKPYGTGQVQKQVDSVPTRSTRWRCDAEKGDFRDAGWIHLGWWRHVKTTLAASICDSGPQ